MESKTTKISPRCRHTHFFRILSWNSVSQPHLFLSSSCSTCLSTHLTVENSKASLWNPRNSENGDMPEHFQVRQDVFSCYAIFTWIWTYKTHDLADCQLQVNVGNSLPTITFMWIDRQVPGWPRFYQQQLFPSVPSLVESFHSVCFRIFAAPVMWSTLKTAVLRPPRLFSIVHSFLKASSSSSRVRIWSLRSLRTISFRNISWHAPLKTLPSLFWYVSCCISAKAFELLMIAAQAPPHRTTRKVRNPSFPHGIPVCVGSLEKSNLLSKPPLASLASLSRRSRLDGLIAVLRLITVMRLLPKTARSDPGTPPQALPARCRPHCRWPLRRCRRRQQQRWPRWLHSHDSWHENVLFQYICNQSTEAVPALTHTVSKI